MGRHANKDVLLGVVFELHTCFKCLRESLFCFDALKMFCRQHDSVD